MNDTRRSGTRRVSVLISAYNYARYLAEAVRSALSQDWPGELECVVVDDGSTDETAQVVADFGGRIRYLRQENRGQSAAMNTGFAASSGDVVCFLDADDLWKSSKVRRVVEAFDVDPTVGLVHHEVDTVDGAGRPLPGFLGRYPRADGDVSHLMRRKSLPWMFNPTSSLSLRRAVCEPVFPLLETLRGNGDELMACAAALLAPVRHLPEALSWYRVHGENLWAQTRPGQDRSSTPAVGMPREDVHGYGEPRHYVRLLEEKIRQANLSLARAGLPGGLSPYLKWTYLKFGSELEGSSPLARWREVLFAAAGARGLRPWGRASLAVTLLRRMLRHEARRRFRRDGRSPGAG